MKRTFSLATMQLLLCGLAGCGGDDMAAGACAMVTCPTGQSCDPATGACTSGKPVDKCLAAMCGAGQTCDPQVGVCTNPKGPPPPPPPVLGTLLYRMGRPAINTLLTNPFEVVKINNVVQADGNLTRSLYSQDGNPGNWSPAWSPYIRFHLGLFDGLDRICANQLLSTGAGTAARYQALTDTLTLDALHLDTSQSTCSQYLAVESAATVAPGLKDCGGRTLDYDVVDATYTVLITGDPNKPVRDGIDKSSGQPLPTFPFMAAPLAQ